MDRTSGLGSAMERNTESAFLRQFLVHDASEAGRRLHGRLVQSERDGRCICRAVLLMLGLFMLSLVGLAYCAVLAPEYFRNPRHLLLLSLFNLGLGSLISQVAFLGYLLWHHAVARHLHRECRLLILTLAGSELAAGAAAILAVDFPADAPIGADRGFARPTGRPPEEQVSQEFPGERARGMI